MQGIWETPWTFNSTTLISGRETLKIWLLSHGKTIYPLPGEYPLLVTLYTPFFFVLGAVLNGILHNPATSGMLLSVVPFVILMALVFFWTRKEGGSWTAAAMATVVLITSREIINAGTMIRPDWLAWLFAYSGAFLVMSKAPSTRRMVAGCLLLAAATLTKQQTFPIIIGLVTIWVTDRLLLRRSVFILILTGPVMLAGALLTQWLSGGGFIIDALKYPVILAANPDITNWSFAWPRIRLFSLHNAPVLLLWAAALLRDLTRRKIHWLDWILIVHIPFLLRLLMTWGAADNYYWGFMVAIHVRAGLFLAEFMVRDRRFTSVAALFFTTAVFVAASPLPHQPADADVIYDSFNKDRSVIARYDNGKDPMLMNSELSGYYLPDEYTSRIHFFDAIEYFYFELAGFWKFTGSRLETDIIDRKFATVVLGNTYINPNLKDIIEYFYNKVFESSIISIYAPKPGDVVLYRVPTDIPIEKGRLRVQVTGVDGIEANAGFGGFSFSRIEGSKESYVEFTLTKDAFAQTTHVVFLPKVASVGPENGVFVEWAQEGDYFRPLFTSYGTPEDMSNRIGAFPATLSVDSSSRLIRFRFHPRGNGQLWFSQEVPLLFRVVTLEQ